MCLSKSHTTVNKERVIGLSRLFRHCHTCCMGKLIPRTNDKVFECIFWVQLDSPSRPGLRWAPRPVPDGLGFALQLSSILTDGKCNGHHLSLTSRGHGFCQQGSIMSVQPFSKEFIRNSNMRRRVLNTV